MNNNKYKYFFQNVNELQREREYFKSFVNSKIIDMINISTLKNLDINVLNNQISEIDLEVEETIKSALSVQLDLSLYLGEIKKQLTFLDKFIFGLFGNKDRMDFYSDIEGLLKKQEGEIKKLYSYTKQNIKSKVYLKEKIIVKEYLLKNDKEYRLNNSKLISMQDISYEMKILLEDADKALNSIKDSESLEVFDMMSSNKMMGAMSAISTSDTNSKINTFKDKIKAFYEFRYDDLTNLNTLDFMDDIFEFNIGIDLFGGLMQLDSLNKAEKQIEEIVIEIKKEINSLEKGQSIMHKKMSKRVSEVSNFKIKV